MGNPANLKWQDRWNPSLWNPVTLDGLRHAAVGISSIAFTLGVVAIVRKVFGMLGIRVKVMDEVESSESRS